MTFLVMGAMILALPRFQRPSDGPAQGSTGSRHLLGFGILFRMRPVLLLSLLTLLFLFIHGLPEVVIPVYSQKTLGSGSVGYGLLMTASSIGSLLALALETLGHRLHQGPSGFWIAYERLICCSQPRCKADEILLNAGRFGAREALNRASIEE